MIAEDCTDEEIAQILRERNIPDRPGTITTLHVHRTSDGTVRLAIDRMKEGYHRTLQSRTAEDGHNS